MGKKQHQKDKMYLTTQEWKQEWGGYKDKTRIPFKRLPFHCCAISFTPFEEPVCTDDGIVYDIINAVPYVMKYKRHPITGQPLHVRDLIKLNFYKNDEGQYHCPVMHKVFTEHTHIVAVKTTGNVYCYEAVEELNIKAKSWRDLLTDEPFTRKDIIHIQDPLNLQGRTIETFDHVQKGLQVEEDEGEDDPANSLRNMSEDMKRALGALKTKESKEAFDRGGGGKRAEMARLLAAAKAGAGSGKQQGSGAAAASAAAGGAAAAATDAGAAAAGGSDWRLRAPERTAEAAPQFKPGAVTWDTEDYTTAAGKALKKHAEKMHRMAVGDKAAAAEQAAAAAAPKKGTTPKERYEAEGHVKWIESMATTGTMASSFTSTSAAITTKNQRQLKRFERNPTKKGYLRLHTNLGDLNVELHCDIVPRTCENFLALCTMGYYDGVVFHRSIKNFMIQGGDPTGTGMGGESIYGKTFKDELDSRLIHNGRGILSMANSGPSTNGSQFFITYKSCRHLDFKHSVFGRVVGGLDVLTAMERVATDDEDRPQQEIKITGATVFTNPFQEMEDEEKKAEEKAAKEAAREAGLASNDPEHKVGKWFSAPSGAPQSAAAAASEGGVGGGVGKYLSVAALQTRVTAAPAEGAAEAAPPAKKPKVASGFGNFDSW